MWEENNSGDNDGYDASNGGGKFIDFVEGIIISSPLGEDSAT